MEESNRFISPVDRKATMRAQLKAPPENPDAQCGVGSCKPGCMKCCGNIICFTAFYSMAGLFSSTISMYVNSQITTMEKYFGFSSSQSGFVMTCNDIGFLLTTIFVSHNARKVHIPRVLSMTTIVFGVSGILCSLAYFLSPTFMTEGQGLLKGEHIAESKNVYLNDSLTTFTKGGQLCDGKDKDICLPVNVTNSEMKVGAPTDFTPIALAILAIGMLLQGFAKSPRQPFVTCYIDDNGKKTSTGMYLGVIMCVGVFGPAIAFGLGGFFTQIYITLEDVSIDVSDPRWVGAWWLGFILFGFLAILSGIPVFFFPRRLKPRPVDHADGKSGLLENTKEILKGLWKLATNRLYMLIVLSNCLILFFIGGNVPFQAKYMETQFQTPAWIVNLVMGIIGIFGAAFGSFLGGCVVSKFKLSPIACAKLILGISSFSILLPILGYSFGCDNPKIVGINSDGNIFNGFANCTESCLCDDGDYFPVCGSDGRNYFSPCHAGCSEQQGQTFVRCGCVGVNGTASPGLCDTDCKMFVPYAVLTLFSSLILTVVAMPGVIFTIRCVTDKEKSLAVGLSTFLQTLLGWCPGPVVIGMVIDTSCFTWNSSCDDKGACSLYDIEDFRLKRHAIELAIKFLILLMHIAMLIFARRTDWSQLSNEETDTTKPETEMLMISNVKAKRSLAKNKDPSVENT